MRRVSSGDVVFHGMAQSPSVLYLVLLSARRLKDRVSRTHKQRYALKGARKVLWYAWQRLGLLGYGLEKVLP